MRKRSKGTELYDFHLDHCFDKQIDWQYIIGVLYSEKKEKMVKEEVAEMIKNFYERIILPVLKEELIDLLELARKYCDEKKN